MKKLVLLALACLFVASCSAMAEGAAAALPYDSPAEVQKAQSDLNAKIIGIKTTLGKFAELAKTKTAALISETEAKVKYSSDLEKISKEKAALSDAVDKLVKALDAGLSEVDTAATTAQKQVEAIS